jgi:heme/copper-type cytochrome/quinol oxidase subunit 3
MPEYSYPSYKQFNYGAVNNCFTAEGKKNLSIFFQALTILLALAFMVNKYFEWTAKFHHGIYPGGDELLAMESW